MNSIRLHFFVIAVACAVTASAHFGGKSEVPSCRDPLALLDAHDRALADPNEAFARPDLHPGTKAALLANMANARNHKPGDTYAFVPEDITVETLVASGVPIDVAALRVLRVPEEYHRFYDEHGGFHYAPATPRELAAENGDHPLEVLRMQFRENRTELYLADYVGALARMPGSELWLTVPASAGATPEARHAYVLRHLKSPPPAEVAKRIRTMSGEDQPQGFFEWARDLGKALKARSAALLVPHLWMKTAPGRDESNHAVLASLRGDGVVTETSPFRFDGGNLIVGAKHVFVGTSTIRDNMAHLRISREKVLAAMERDFGKPVFEVGAPLLDGRPLRQLDYHIDLSMLVARDKRSGKEVVLLSSDQKAREVLEAAPSLDSREQWLLGRARDGSVGREVWNRALREKLTAQGYQVVEVPGFALGKTNNGKLEFVNYTNSVLGGEFALIPEMGSPVLDAHFKKVIENLGYEAIGMPHAPEMLKEEGGVACATGMFPCRGDAGASLSTAAYLRTLRTLARKGKFAAEDLREIASVPNPMELASGLTATERRSWESALREHRGAADFDAAAAAEGVARLAAEVATDEKQRGNSTRDTSHIPLGVEVGRFGTQVSDEHPHLAPLEIGGKKYLYERHWRQKTLYDLETGAPAWLSMYSMNEDVVGDLDASGTHYVLNTKSGELPELMIQSGTAPGAQVRDRLPPAVGQRLVDGSPLRIGRFVALRQTGGEKSRVQWFKLAEGADAKVHGVEIDEPKASGQMAAYHDGKQSLLAVASAKGMSFIDVNAEKLNWSPTVGANVFPNPVMAKTSGGIRACVATDKGLWILDPVTKTDFGIVPLPNVKGDAKIFERDGKHYALVQAKQAFEIVDIDERRRLPPLDTQVEYYPRDFFLESVGGRDYVVWQSGGSIAIADIGAREVMQRTKVGTNSKFVPYRKVGDPTLYAAVTAIGKPVMNFVLVGSPVEHK